MQIVLATASPRRHHLFKQVGIPFLVDPADIEEIIPENGSPDHIVRDLAQQKGNCVAKRHTDSLILSADTIVVLEGQILGKPENPAHAISMLRSLRGTTHQVFTGVSCILVDKNGTLIRSFSFAEKTNVTFSALSIIEIEQYVASGTPMDKAGAYGIQDDFGSLFVKRIEGDYYNVVGFPLNLFYETIKKKLPAIWSELFLHEENV